MAVLPPLLTHSCRECGEGPLLSLFATEGLERFPTPTQPFTRDLRLNLGKKKKNNLKKREIRSI